MSEDLSKKVRELADESGADLIGIASAASFNEAPEKHRPEDFLKGAKSVIVIGMIVPIASMESAPSREYSIAYSTVNHELDRVAYELSKFLQKKGHLSMQIPSAMPYDYKHHMGAISHRHAGLLAGIGVFGKNSLLLSPKNGPRIRLTSIITEADLKADAPIDSDLCEGCDECIQACPSRALEGDGIVDKMACDAYHIQVGEQLQLEDDEQICGVCIAVCPIGKKLRQ